MSQLLHNVTKFNVHINLKVIFLKQNGAGAPELVHQIFSAYFSCPDK